MVPKLPAGTPKICLNQTALLREGGLTPSLNRRSYRSLKKAKKSTADRIYQNQGVHETPRLSRRGPSESPETARCPVLLTPLRRPPLTRKPEL